MSKSKLTREIIDLSLSDTWDKAKEEWSLHDVFVSHEPGTCLCGHYPILEHCVLHNRENDNQVVVGNHCVNRFVGLPSRKLFQGINRISQDQSRALNSEMILHAHGRGWITKWERDFYIDTHRKREPSDKQMLKRIQINQSILERVGG